MSDIVIRAENLGKRYRIGERVRYKTLRDSIAGLFRPRRPQTEGLRSPVSGLQSSTDTIWALKDVSFEIKRGEVVGIIGRNGAGKSTLLKILSRITEPTEGFADINGRVGSLLEVGTGFHPELTGRENIYLNGAILGMKRAEIAKKFDEIVAFAEVEKFLDTPVKHYSSGMYVRLAFAVAAHLEPEILLVDEVLAVGDAAFQKKCLGKMGDVAREGRTVLFVSHNLPSIRTLCSRSLLVADGKIQVDAATNVALSRYAAAIQGPLPVAQAGLRNRMNRASGAVRFTHVAACNRAGEITWDFKPGDTIQLHFSYQTHQPVPSVGLYVAFLSSETKEELTTFKEVISATPPPIGQDATAVLELPDNRFRPGDYLLYAFLGDRNCEKAYDVIDTNVNLPSLHVFSDEQDLHRTLGYFTMPARLTVKSNTGSR